MQLLRIYQELNPSPPIVYQIMLFKGQDGMLYPWIASAEPGWLPQPEPVDTATSPPKSVDSVSQSFWIVADVNLFIHACSL